MDRLFLGIADTNHYALIVVGNSFGEIICTGVGGSVNHRCWGLEQARFNLKNILAELGTAIRVKIAGVCFTYMRENEVARHEVLPVADGLVHEAALLHVEDFTTTGALGIHSPKERLFLMGDHLGLAILQSEGGQRCAVRHEELLENSLFREGCLLEWVKALDRLGEQGDFEALWAACNVSCHLVRLAGRLGRCFSRPDPVIGLSGSVLLGSQTIRQMVENMLSALYPQAEVIDAPLAPAKGAYLSSLFTRKRELRREVLTMFYDSACEVMKRGWLDFVIHNSPQAQGNRSQVVWTPLCIVPAAGV
jgi:hypothetical protein